MKSISVILAGAVALTVGLAHSQPIDLISNLSQSDDAIASPDLGMSFGTAFSTGADGCSVYSITVEQWPPLGSEPSDVKITLLKPSINPETGLTCYLPVGEFGQTDLEAADSDVLGQIYYATATATKPVTLQPYSEYLIAVSSLGDGSVAPQLVFTESTQFLLPADWQKGYDFFRTVYYDLEFWNPVSSPHLKFKMAGIIGSNQAPDVSKAHASVPVLWSPNGEMVTFQVEGVTDPDGDPVSIIIKEIQQDEPVRAPGDKTTPDAIIIGDNEGQVRAERLGYGNGRVYRVTFTADDGKPGGSVQGVVSIFVPHDQRGEVTAIDDGPELGYFSSTCSY